MTLRFVLDPAIKPHREPVLAKKNTTQEGMIAALRSAALSHPDVDETIACKGTAIESASFKIRGKAFLFLRSSTAMLKLVVSLPEAAELAKKNPQLYKPGSGGWTSISLSQPQAIPLAKLKKWIKESYLIMSTVKTRKKK